MQQLWGQRGGTRCEWYLGFGDRLNAGAEGGVVVVVIPRFLAWTSRWMVVPHKDSRKSTVKDKDDKMSFGQTELETTVR